MKFVDEQIEKGISHQIETLYKYTIQCVEKKQGVYSQVLDFMKEKDFKFFRDTREFRIILGGLYGLERLRELENPTNETIFQLGRIAAALLSPELFDINYQHELNPKYGIYQVSLKSVGILHALSNEVLAVYKSEQDEANEPSHIFAIEGSPKLICKYFRPIIMIGEDAIFHFETFFYALSKGCVLFGLTDEQSFAHGGIFKAPIEVYAHDQSHHDWLLEVEQNCDEYTYEYTRNSLVEIATKFYELLCVNRIFGDVATQDYKRARLAAFYFLHENRVGSITRSWSSSLQEVFGKLMSKMISRLGVDLGATNTYLKRPEIQPFLYDVGFIEQGTDFDIKFGCEHSMLLVDVFPELADEIYGKNNDGQDRTLYYHAQMTEKHLLDTIDWFFKKIIQHL